MPTHYEVLGVHPASEQEVIEAAYKALIRKYHPDRAGDNERIRQINAAYSILKSPIKRRAYDATLKLFPSKELTVPGVKRADHGPHSKTQRAAPGRQEKKCPDCLENVALGARVCRHCGYRFQKTERPSNPFRAGCGFAVALALLIAFLSAILGSDGDIGNEMVASAEAGECGPESIQLDLGRVKAQGTLELLVRKLETDEYNQLVIGLNSGNCIGRAEIDELVRASGGTGPVELLVGHDPNGSLYEFRSRYAYDPLGLAPLSDMSPPPADMHFGEAKWDANGTSQRLAVSWYGNFQQWLERAYEAAGASTADADGLSSQVQVDAASGSATAPTVPALYRGRWAVSAEDCLAPNAMRIAEAGVMEKTAGDLVAVSQLSALTAVMTFSMADGRGPFTYQERWTINADRSRLLIESIEDGSQTSLVACSS